MKKKHLNHTFLWLSTLIALVFLTVLIGGITRLTHSGLSMVEWQPLIGVVPPLTEHEWQATFSRYQEFPEYRLINKGMTLAEFKFIFLWEYCHRILGRLIGLVFAVPFVCFLTCRYFNREWVFKLTAGFLLGASQGALGWYMVKSGLVNNPFVSHYRLAAHLLLATVILMYLTWLALETRMARSTNSYSLPAILLVGLVLLQFTWGALVAGKRAGFAYNTFPLMNGKLIPDSLLTLSPVWLNFLESNIAIQFLHRWLGILTFAVAILIWLHARKSTNGPHRRWCQLLAGVTTLQVVLGITTLVLVVPIPLASAHQAVGMMLAVISVGVMFTWPAKQETVLNAEPTLLLQH